MKSSTLLYGGVGVFFILLSTTGCASKQDRQLFDEIRSRSGELQRLQQTEKAVFHQGDENETVVIATYLPDQSGPEGEEFILAVHPAEGLGSPAFEVDGLPPKTLHRTARSRLSAEYTKTLPPWFSTYRARFAPAKHRRFALSIRSRDGEIRRLAFVKGPKYLVRKTKGVDSSR